MTSLFSLLDAVMKEDVVMPLDDDVTVLNKVNNHATRNEVPVPFISIVLRSFF